MADDFGIRRSDIFFIMGGSGCGKSTLLRHPIGLNEPARGQIWFGDVNLRAPRPRKRDAIRRRFGILFQSACFGAP